MPFEPKRTGIEFCQSCPVRGHALCRQLSVRTLERLAFLARTHRYRANHCFWDEDSRPGFIGIVHTGYLRIVRYSLDGRRQITALVGPGETVGEGIHEGVGYALEAATATTLCRFERPAFERLMTEESELRRAVYREYADRLEKLRRLAWMLALQSPEERLCTFLSNTHGAMPWQPLPGGGGVLTVEIPRADVADLLGTTKEQISRVTHRLAAAGLIEIRDPRHFLIPDVARLRQAGGLGAIVAAASTADTRARSPVHASLTAPPTRTRLSVAAPSAVMDDDGPRQFSGRFARAGLRNLAEA